MAASAANHKKNLRQGRMRPAREALETMGIDHRALPKNILALQPCLFQRPHLGQHSPKLENFMVVRPNPICARPYFGNLEKIGQAFQTQANENNKCMIVFGTYMDIYIYTYKYM